MQIKMTVHYSMEIQARLMSLNQRNLDQWSVQVMIVDSEDMILCFILGINYSHSHGVKAKDRLYKFDTSTKEGRYN